MNHPHDPTRTPAFALRSAAGLARPRRRGGFTLTELLVAVGAVVLLTLGIGQIFSTVGKLVNTGSALSEVDQMARAIEKQMRNDFAALSRVPADESFLAIRQRVVYGTYATRDEREADAREGTQLRARARRVDEIGFLAYAGEGDAFTSFQMDVLGRTDWTSRSARVYYGHTLKPRPDPDFDPDDAAGPNIPERQFYPDGNFGQRPGEANQFLASVISTGRNEYAGDWSLGRQALLLSDVSSYIVGYPQGAGTGAGVLPPPKALIGDGREYAPFIRDLEARIRMVTVGEAVGEDIDGSGPSNATRPNPRMIKFGRTDICAQSPFDVRRWLEGRDPATVPVDPLPADASAYEAGRFNKVGTAGQLVTTWNANEPDAPLYQRFGVTNANHQIDNLRLLQTAIAGTLMRLQGESSPPPIDRGGDDSNLAAFDAEDAVMDIHTLLAERCSNFEVAWSDGTVWQNRNQPLQVDSDFDGAPDTFYRYGDIIWFDIALTQVDLRTADPARYGNPNNIPFPNPEIIPQQRNTRLVMGNATSQYSIRENAAAQQAFIAPNQRVEYHAIWGFREPAPGGGFGAAWEKPTLIRVRMTLHDSQFRLPEGRQYEFVFRVNQP